MRVLVTGATGYIGGRLVPRLLERGHKVRVLARTPQKLAGVPWGDRVDVVDGDLLDPGSVRKAVDGIEVVYYLAHSMGSRGDFAATERRGAMVMATAAKAAGVRRFVYLGGLHPDGKLSRHLASRVEVGDILLRSGVPTIAYQAGVVIGSGSTSFEMIRHLTDVLPWMPAPRWVRNFIQPIAVRDVLHYLLGALDIEDGVNRTFDIAGPDVLRYGQMLNGYAVEAKLPQRAISVLPVLTPRLAAHWCNVVTPIPRALAVPIIESLQYECVQREHDIDDYVPPPAEGLTGYRRAVRLALARMRSGEVETSWRGASTAGAPSDPLPNDPDWAGHTVYVDDRVRRSTAPAADVWRIVESIGGDNGWYSFPLAWSLRGWMDRFAGGVGLTRGRRDPNRLEQGDVLDWWRVERLERGRYLRLRAEFKAPGRAWLEMTVEAEGDGSVYHQRAIFFPQGLLGRLYWYSILPFHGVIFPGMVERITTRAERESRNRVRSGDNGPNHHIREAV